MVVVVFGVICSAAVLFLLRFLFALESEARSTRKRHFEMVKLSVYRARPISQTDGSAPALMLIHSNVSRQAATSRTRFVDRFAPPERHSHYMGA